MEPQIFIQYAWLLPLLVAWVLPWKAVALWRAAKKGQKVWFVALLLLNTLAVLEILYIFVFGKKRDSRQRGFPPEFTP